MNGHLDDIHLGMYKKYSKYYRALPMLWWKKKAPVSSAVDGIVEKEKFFVSLMQQFLTFNFVSLWHRAYVFPGKHQFMEWTSPLWPPTSHIRHILLKLSVAQRVKEAIKNRFLRKLIFIHSLAPNFLISRVHDPPHSLWCLRGLFNYPFLDLTIRYCLGWSVGMTLPTKRDNFKLLCRYIHADRVIEEVFHFLFYHLREQEQT